MLHTTLNLHHILVTRISYAKRKLDVPLDYRRATFVHRNVRVPLDVHPHRTCIRDLPLNMHGPAAHQHGSVHTTQTYPHIIKHATGDQNVLHN